jgi:5-methyltetrahydropteroyltriglutamate--homocysteine methyltransferase
VTAHAYDDVDEFWNDTVAAFRQELAALAAAGCTYYVQIDETAFAKIGDPQVQASVSRAATTGRRSSISISR